MPDDQVTQDVKPPATLGEMLDAIGELDPNSVTVVVRQTDTSWGITSDEPVQNFYVTHHRGGLVEITLDFT